MSFLPSFCLIWVLKHILICQQMCIHKYYLRLKNSSLEKSLLLQSARQVSFVKPEWNVKRCSNVAP